MQNNKVHETELSKLELKKLVFISFVDDFSVGNAWKSNQPVSNNQFVIFQYSWLFLNVSKLD